MICKVDWISFVVRLDSAFDGGSTFHNDYVMGMLRDLFAGDTGVAMFDQPFAVARGRAPYSVCLRREDQHLSVFYGGKQAHILIEITGAGCEALERRSQLVPLLEMVGPVLTRLDVAVDLPVSCKPIEFVSAGYSARIKANSSMVSDTGETVYIGSRDSERYCQVYRYNPPHPRSEWLRVEYVNKHENAAHIASLILDVGLPEVVARLGNVFAWKHPAWQPDKTTEATVSGWTPERRHGATVRWLLTSVFPAMARLVKDGTIDDLPAFLDTHLYRLVNDQ